MARPYSQDLRDRVVSSVAGGRTCRATAALFGVSAASVVKWSQRWRASGSAAAKQMGGWRQLRLQREREWLLARSKHPAKAMMGDRYAAAAGIWRSFQIQGSSSCSREAG
jgi:transposase